MVITKADLQLIIDESVRGYSVGVQARDLARKLLRHFEVLGVEELHVPERPDPAPPEAAPPAPEEPPA